MICYLQAQTKEELHQILELQRRNLPNALSRDEMQKEGFVTVAHTFDILKRMNDVCPHILAKHNDKVIGYALCMHPSFEQEIPILRPMFHEIKTVHKNHDFMVMGQICIAKPFRGQGIFQKMYAAMKTSLPPEFSKIITEVDAQNQRSLTAHTAVGFKKIKQYRANGKEWILIVL
ncbi:MAG: N-acetyltransferase family protein [Flavobacteriaceae bacterium]